MSCLLGSAIYRLAPRVMEAVEMGLSTFQWVVMGVFAVFMIYSEGYKGFQKKFSPRSAARVRYLRDHPVPLHVLVAPVFVMGFFHATRKTRLTVTILTVAIALLVFLVSKCPQPWRGVIDLGVVVGLSYGLASFWASTAKALAGESYPHSPQVPDCEGGTELV
ncbi:hypothetical protein [Sulfuriroseicoccus oceanibius]|uniref:Uncharacterized protein n=1 Tax=Sulfuriroseicoccus oceanibius TaxID=2707525 RepID=A0A6B3LEI2_9BACT|nr:hypothetical protein [Sulfuriroseicoccus oceanibius]QQL44795.1 hypothetical protein G3M56_013080 [Sulfuriroseicoccus oceanibius]